MVEVLASVAMLVGEDVAVVDGDPEPQPLWSGDGQVVVGEPGDKIADQQVQKGRGGDSGAGPARAWEQSHTGPRSSREGCIRNHD
jgi:hypothetical protein